MTLLEEARALATFGRHVRGLDDKSLLLLQLRLEEARRAEAAADALYVSVDRAREAAAFKKQRAQAARDEARRKIGPSRTRAYPRTGAARTEHERSLRPAY